MMKKIISVLLALTLTLLLGIPAFAVTMQDGTGKLCDQFVYGEGPEIDGTFIDYRYFSPVKENDTAKYPLVVWLHGMGNGSKEGVQITASNVSYWSSEEFQARFTNGGAFILAARSDETKGLCWNEGTIEPLKACIDDFIAKNKDNIDLSRIYVGGYSMGGKMTLKMAIAYPEMFAAAFPICPAWSPDMGLLEKIADMPVWFTSGKTDPLVNYFFGVTVTFKNLSAVSNVPGDVRFSSLKKVCFEDGKRTTSAHHSWYAVNHDMFSSENGDYPYMSTVNGLGEEVTLTYPNGMISWLCSHTSDYDGAPSEGKGNLENASGIDSLVGQMDFMTFFRILFEAITSLFGLI